MSSSARPGPRERSGAFAPRDQRDRIEIWLSLLPAGVWLVWPHPLVIGAAIWWLGNTVAHHAVHRRFFVARRSERVFGTWLSLWLGAPFHVWRQRHLAHHAGRRWRLRVDRVVLCETVVVAGWWLAIAAVDARFLLLTYAPGWLFGMTLAVLHGHFEHRGGITDIRARWWNVLMLHDGWHAAHHASPGRHWRELPGHVVAARVSRLPPPLRWLRALTVASCLDRAERLVLRAAWLRRVVLAVHRRALRAVLAGEVPPRSIVVIGGGLFPRSALLLRELFPDAAITVLDGAAAHLATARRWLPADVGTSHRTFVPGTWLGADLVVVPLAFRGGRQRLLATPPAPRVLVHDWAWHRPGDGRVVAWWLGKRIYLVRGEPLTNAVLSASSPA